MWSAGMVTEDVFGSASVGRPNIDEKASSMSVRIMPEAAGTGFAVGIAWCFE